MTGLIDADAIKYTMLYKENWLKGTGVEKQGVWKEDIDAMPTVDAEPVRHGKWKMLENYYGEEAKCSECGFTMCVNEQGNGLPDVESLNYCPHCGARMDEE